MDGGAEGMNVKQKEACNNSLIQSATIGLYTVCKTNNEGLVLSGDTVIVICCLVVNGNRLN